MGGFLSAGLVLLTPCEGLRPVPDQIGESGQSDGRALLRKMEGMKTPAVCWLNLCLFIFVFLGAAACGGGGSLRDEPLSTVTISLDRGPCFGFCPDYSVTIKGDGTVIYEGRNFVPTQGTITTTVPVESVERLVAEFDDADFFALEEDYSVNATDLPTTITTLSIGGTTKRIVHYGVGCDVDDPVLDTAPEALCRLEALIDEVAGTKKWVSRGN